MTTAVALHREDLPQPVSVALGGRLITEPEINVIKIIAATVIDAGSSMVPQNIKTQAQALAVMFAGHEIGLPPMTALRHVFIVNGRTEFTTQVLMGLVDAGDPTAQFVFYRYDRDGCEVELRRRGRAPVRAAYTREDASASGQLKVKMRKTYADEDRYWDNGESRYKLKRGAQPTGEEEVPGPWQLYPRDMYAWAAVKRACRLGAPDLINRIPSYRAANVVDALPEPEWVANPQLRAPGDEGDEIPAVTRAAAEAGGDLDDFDVPPADDGPVFDESGQAIPETGEAIPETEPATAAADHPSEAAAALRQKIAAIVKDITETWSGATAQTFVIELWRRFPSSRKDNKTDLEAVPEADLEKLYEFAEFCQRESRLPPVK